jgi:hypothetical protein
VATPNQVVERFKAEHVQLAAVLVDCRSASSPAELAAKLTRHRPQVLEHLEAKDRFYVDLVALCSSRRDESARTIAEIFAQNMKTQSGAIRTFFLGLDRATLSTLTSSFETMAFVLTSRFSTEERTVLPLYVKQAVP